MNWRGWLAFAGIGSAVALACCRDWLAAGEAAAAVLLPVSAWALGQFAATRAMLRSLAGMSEMAAICPSLPGGGAEGVSGGR